MSLNVRQLQDECAAWRLHNFPATVTDPQNRHHQLLGLVEEVGELAHTVLKFEQRIREGLSEGKLTVDLEDGVGDLVIFLTGFCDRYGIDLETAIEETWARVKQRDWTVNPVDGS